jgi:hypothetical protein
MRKLITLAILFFAVVLVAPAQLQPQGAHVNLYFPHLVDGGDPAVQQWQTTFTFVNVSTLTANVNMWLYDDNGNPLTLDLGNGPVSSFYFQVPANGELVLKSQRASTTVLQGWAAAFSDVPLQATVAFRAFDGQGRPFQEIAAQPTLPTLTFTTAATPLLGIALANTFQDAPTTVDLTLYDTAGSLVGGPVPVQIPTNGHIAFNLNSVFSLPGNFMGVLKMEGHDPTFPDRFVAWALGSDGILFTTLPPGDFPWPISHWDRIWLVWENVYAAAVNLNNSFATPAGVSLGILGRDPAHPEDQRVDAFTNGSGEVDLTYALSELIGDDQSELAFAMGHALGHIYQQRNNNQLLYGTDLESDADRWAINIMLAASYDPYAAAGTLAKLMMATTNSQLTATFDNMDSATANSSITTRLAGIFGTLQAACGGANAQGCAYSKSVVHPDLPGTAPLLVKPQPRPTVNNNSGGRRAQMPRRSVTR